MQGEEGRRGLWNSSHRTEVSSTRGGSDLCNMGTKNRAHRIEAAGEQIFKWQRELNFKSSESSYKTPELLLEAGGDIVDLTAAPGSWKLPEEATSKVSSLQ